MKEETKKGLSALGVVILFPLCVILFGWACNECNKEVQQKLEEANKAQIEAIKEAVIEGLEELK